MHTWVYKYRFWNEDLQQYLTSTQYFTMEAIRSGLGVPIVESGMKVTLDEVDDYGKLKRRKVIPPAA